MPRIRTRVKALRKRRLNKSRRRRKLRRKPMLRNLPSKRKAIRKLRRKLLCILIKGNLSIAKIVPSR
jgi:hypothetical protein